ncbi:MAG: hypothetical protein DRG40_07510 [Deltaproteobacteria bacterium]|nr:MAG: hypothetical protein DRG40_07510 [Deltaproteobacteria bacterium]
MRRKLMHSFGLPIPIGYYFVSRETLLMVLLPVFVLYAGADLLRLYHKGFRRFFDRLITSRFLREREYRGLIGSTYFLIGAIAAILLYRREAVITALFILLISDTFASLVGSAWGKRRLFGPKTLEGSMAFLITALVVVFLSFPKPFPWGVISALLCTVVEALPWKIDDNLTLPLIGGGILHLGLIT